MSAYLQQFAERFAQLDGSRLHGLEKLYADDITFRDPLHEIQGLEALRAYFAQLYANTHDIRYVFCGANEVSPGEGYLRWSLQFRHPDWPATGRSACKDAATCDGVNVSIFTGLLRYRCPAL